MGEDKYKCPMDGEMFNSVEELQKHSKEMHGKEMSPEEAEKQKAEEGQGMGQVGEY